MRLDPTVLPAETVMRMATIDGARGPGPGAAEIGSIEPENKPTSFVIDTEAPHLTPMHHPASAVVYAAKGSDVSSVMVAGRLLVRDRRVLTVDMEEVRAQVGMISQAIMPQLKGARGKNAWT